MPLARHWRRAVWIALFAVLLNALAPAITSVKAAWRAAPAAHCDETRAPRHAGVSTAAAAVSAISSANVASRTASAGHCDETHAPHQAEASTTAAPASAIPSANVAPRTASTAHGDEAHPPHPAAAPTTAAPAAAASGQPHADCAHAPLDACPFCHVHAGSFGLPAPDPQPPAATATPDATPAAWSPAPHRFDPWRHAHPRGPPVSA